MYRLPPWWHCNLSLLSPEHYCISCRSPGQNMHRMYIHSGHRAAWTSSTVIEPLLALEPLCRVSCGRDTDDPLPSILTTSPTCTIFLQSRSPQLHEIRLRCKQTWTRAGHALLGTTDNLGTSLTNHTGSSARTVPEARFTSISVITEVCKVRLGSI